VPGDTAGSTPFPVVTRGYPGRSLGSGMLEAVLARRPRFRAPPRDAGTERPTDSDLEKNLGRTRMDQPDQDHATRIVGELTGGDRQRAPELARLVYDNLRRYAAAMMRGERGPGTMEPTALVHEAYVRLVDQSRVSWQGRTHFFAVGAEMVRRVLVDHARRRGALKRGGERRRLTLDSRDAGAGAPGVDTLALDDALRKLAGLDPRAARVVELRFFGGMRESDIAELIGVSPSTVRDDWRMARVWLRHELSEAADARG
jgi:RNA polymerase sigma-70 factor, ECF subfamily